ncbi:hypothetical protein C9374_010335 [Naegleria lovaniensis]|uniref:F-box domain-containing protein n=1 Tax=Naegleria lovaniensis TaxID=51637 RepID=A0AA88KGK0_NAELO|nr:uncharacterized protein C9374_010335 [Naegleria lovaniensis]KAG2374961.1 hypothetical protein C9374_010335 [Naegleria lovaniensis]
MSCPFEQHNSFVFLNGVRYQIHTQFNTETHEFTQIMHEISTPNQQYNKKRKDSPCLTNNGDNQQFRKILKIVKQYTDENFIPIQHELLLKQKDMFWEVIQFLEMSDIVFHVRSVCKVWNDWILYEYNSNWKNMYQQNFNNLLPQQHHNEVNGVKFFLFPLYLYRKAQRYHQENYKPNTGLKLSRITELLQLPQMQQLQRALNSCLFIKKFELSEFEYSNDCGMTELDGKIMIHNVHGNGVVLLLDISSSNYSTQFSYEGRDHLTISYRELVSHEEGKNHSLVEISTYNDDTTCDVEREQIELIFEKLGLDSLVAERKNGGKKLTDILEVLTLIPFDSYRNRKGHTFYPRKRTLDYFDRIDDENDD